MSARRAAPPAREASRIKTVSSENITDQASPEIQAAVPPALPPPTVVSERPRSAVAEWTVTILLLLFLTTTLVQAYVIPTGSMEDTLLIGDHLLVDKMAYAPSGPISKYILPYEIRARGDIIVFRYPVDIRQTFVKRVIGEPGDRIRIVNKQIYRNGVALNEPYKYHKTDYIAPYRDNFPSRAGRDGGSWRHRHADQSRGERRSRGSAQQLFRDGR